MTAGFDPEDVARYDGYYASINPWMPKAAVRPIGLGVVADQMLARPALLRSEFHAGFLRPLGCESGVGLTVEREEGRLFLLSILTSEPDPAPAVSAAATAEPQPAGTTDLPEQLSAGEFRKVLLRANRLASTRTCYRKHTTGPDRSVELIAVVAPEGRVQKLKIDRGPLGDCLRKIVNGLEFSAAQKSAQHNFVFHHPDVSQSG